ncbi:MAG: hypothetical protein ACYCTB_10450 [bacterium]
MQSKNSRYFDILPCLKRQWILVSTAVACITGLALPTPREDVPSRKINYYSIYIKIYQKLFKNWHLATKRIILSN